MNLYSTFFRLISLMLLLCPVAAFSSNWTSMNGPAGYYSPQFIQYHQGAYYTSSNNNGSTGTGIWKSTTNGFNWTDVSAGLPNAYARDFASIGSELFVACDTGVFKTNNGGSTWVAADNGLPDFTNVYEMEIHNSRVYACVYYGNGNVELFYSQNGSGNWTSTGYTFSFAMIPNHLYSNGNTLWAATTQGLYKSTDDGVTFNYAGNNIPGSASIGSIVAVGDTAYCGTTNGSYFTTDGGQLWMPINVASIGSTLYTYSWKIIGNTVFAGFTNNGIYSCQVGQTNFTMFGTGYTATNLAWEMATDGNYLFAATPEGIYNCLVSGGAWQQCNGNILRARTRIAFADYFVVMAGAGTITGLQRTTNQGTSWTSTPLQNQFRLFNRGLSYNGNIFLPSNTNIHITDDLGLTFTSPTIAPIPNNDIKVYGSSLIACSGNNVVQSFDEGTTWNILGTGISPSATVYSLGVNGSTIYAGTNTGVFKYDLLSNTWSNYSTGLSGPILVRNIEIAGLTVVINGSLGVYKRGPNDSQWIPGALNTNFNDLLYFEGHLYGAGYNGISVSDNSGKTFHDFNDGLPGNAGEAENLYGHMGNLYCGMREFSAWERTVGNEIQLSFGPLDECAGDSFQIMVYASGQFNNGNKFLIQLSDAYGDFFNAVNMDSVISTSNQFMLTVRIPANTPAGSAYRYRVISDSPYKLGSINPDPLQIRPLLSISTNPSPQSTCDGGDATFSVSANLTNCFYQWQVDINNSGVYTNISNGTTYQGADTAILNISNITTAMNGYRYRCIISAICNSEISNPALLTVNSLTAIITQPQNDTVCIGDPVTFTIQAQGAGNSYQWQSSLNGGSFFNISAGSQHSGVNTSTLQLNFTTGINNGMQYRCLVNGCTESAIATLTVNNSPTAFTLPATIPYCAGADYTFNISSSAGGLTYQWEEDAGSGFLPLSNDAFHSGVTTVELELNAIPASFNNYQYRCKIYGDCAPDSAITSISTLQLQSTPTVDIQPTGTTICEGDSVQIITLGSGSFLNYSWEVNDGTGWMSIPPIPPFSGVNTGTLTIDQPTSAFDGTQYRCKLSGCVNTQVVTLTVNPTPVVTAPIIYYCVFFPPAPLTDATPSGGTYYSNIIVNNEIETNMMTFGQHDYDYIYTDQNGCTGIDSNYIFVVSCGGINEHSANYQQLDLYPNPADQRVTIRTNDITAGEGIVHLYNFSGQLLQQISHPAGEQEIILETQQLPAGIYLITHSSESRISRGKLIITH
jgi:photosystem II stability/assembly factor-like uncharacterized protein